MVTGMASGLPALVVLGVLAIAIGIGGIVWDARAAWRRRSRRSEQIKSPVLYAGDRSSVRISGLRAKGYDGIEIGKDAAFDGEEIDLDLPTEN